MKKLLILLIVPLLFSSCANLSQVKYLPYKFAQLEDIKPITVKVVDDNVLINKEVYKMYITLLRSKIVFYENQIKDYEKFNQKDKK